MKYQYNNPIWLIINYLSSDLYLRYDRFLSWYRNFPSYIQDLWGQFCSRDKRSKLLHESPAILEIQEIILHNVVVPGAECFVSTCGCDHLDPTRNLARQPVDLVGVLALGELAVEEGVVVIRLIFNHLWKWHQISFFLLRFFPTSTPSPPPVSFFEASATEYSCATCIYQL